MTEEQLRKFVEASTWTSAKTMPQIPHQYTLRKNAQRDEEFAAFVEFINTHGYDSKFYSRTYRYLDLDGWQYWSMGHSVDSISLINRAKTNRPDNPIQPNPTPFSLMPWPDIWCIRQKKLVPRQPPLDLG